MKCLSIKKVHVLTQKVDSKYEKFIPHENFIFRCTTTASQLILLVDYQMYKYNLLIEQMRILSCEETHTKKQIHSESQCRTVCVAFFPANTHTHTTCLNMI